MVEFSEFPTLESNGQIICIVVLYDDDDDRSNERVLYREYFVTICPGDKGIGVGVLITYIMIMMLIVNIQVGRVYIVMKKSPKG